MFEFQVYYCLCVCVLSVSYTHLVSFTDDKTESPSTPLQNKRSDDSNEMLKMIQIMLEKHTININNRFDNNDIKFNEIKSEFNSKFDTKFEEQSRQFNELKFDINEVKMKCESSCNELKRDIEKIVESVEEQIKSKNNNDNENGNVIEKVVSCLLYTSRCV